MATKHIHTQTHTKFLALFLFLNKCFACNSNVQERSRGLSYKAVTQTMTISKETPGLILLIAHIIPVWQVFAVSVNITG